MAVRIPRIIQKSFIAKSVHGSEYDMYKVTVEYESHQTYTNHMTLREIRKLEILYELEKLGADMEMVDELCDIKYQEGQIVGKALSRTEE